MASGVVTRSPAVKRRLDAEPGELGVDLRAAAVDDDRAAARRSAGTRCPGRRPCRSASSVIALPPYLTTTVLPWNRCSQGSASISVAALRRAAALRERACRCGHDE